jgi:hypothetical protein
MSDAETRCARCGAPMPCEPEGACWCKDLPPFAPLPTEPAGCLCRPCLERWLAEAKGPGARDGR